ncbi:MAG: helix-turn-helix domain-containing protein [Dysosmobacter sp.]|nr:helix-turn-helix domain-containing protein [Dysosmobacter sp.]
MKRYDLYSKRDPAKNFSPLPNEVFYLGLSYGAIAVYGYLMHIEDRKTFQSYAGYNTIGRAVKMSANTVRKYVLELEERCLIRTEPTTVITRDGRKRNGTLRYHIRPIQEAVDYYHEQQFRQLELDTERQRAQTRLSRLCAAQEPLPVTGRPMTPPVAERGVSGLCGPVCEVGGLRDLPNNQMNRGVEKSAG